MFDRPTRWGTVSFLAAVVVATLTGCGGPPQDAPDASTGVDEGGWQVEAAEAFDRILTETGIPGGAIEVHHQGEQWTYAAGVSDLDSGSETVATDLFAYRSVTKSFTGTAILILTDDGQISLDDPVAQYVSGVPSGEEITIRMLLGMRSGLANYSATSAFQQQLVKDPTRVWTDDELLATAFAEPIVFPPGTSYEYSNTNTVLLGKVLEAVTGQSWWEAVQHLVVEPLRLTTVSYGTDGAPPGGAATPYQVDTEGGEPEVLPLVSPTLFSAAGGLFGTVTDLSSWATALGTGSLLEQATAAERLAAASPTDSDEYSPLYDTYGLAVGTLADWTGHTGVGLGYQALVMYDPVTGDTVAIVLDGTGANPDVPAEIFLDLIASWS